MDEPCVVAGGGPGGMVLTLLLARAGIPVTLLESHQDFDRDFRGDSLHPYTLELLDSLGLAEDLLALPHHPARYFRFHTPDFALTTADYGRVDSKFNYVALMPQARFLDFLAGRIAEYPNATIRTGARVTGLTTADDGTVTGVRLRDGALPAGLVIGADGRFSTLRKAAGLPLDALGASSDLLWFRLPKHDDDPPEADVDLYFGRTHYAGLLSGPHDWQVGYSLPKGGYPAARDAGVEPIRRFVTEHIPWLADRAPLLTDFGQTTLLSVEIARLRTWWRPGLLLLGDAAHVISPVGGNGILMAIQDAVAAANRLVPVLRAAPPGPHPVPDAVLAAVQADRQAAIERVQAQQARIERRIAAARDAGKPLTPPAFLRWLTAVPAVRARAARANAYGPNPPALHPALR
jgi:2-polyprenyl-6-methoxyphenol hydroxylase-like FAD-dependent oxidoreductase